MNLIIQISNNQVMEKLREFGNISYELKSIDAVILEVENETVINEILLIPGVIYAEQETEGCLLI